MESVQLQSQPQAIAWRGFLIAAAVSALLGLMLTPTDAGPRLYGRIYIPLFVLISVVAAFGKRKNKRGIFRTTIALLIALPFLTIPLMIAIYS